MSDKTPLTLKFIRPMLMRGNQESHRAATPLELLYDLVSVIAIASAAAGLHHAIADDHIFEGLLAFGVIFFAIWWPWMNFTWFASAYDTDDVPYRIAILIQMAGALILAASVGDVFKSFDFRLGVIGFIIMRLSLISLWIRVARHNPEHRLTAQRYVIGLILCQIAWTLLTFVAPESFTLLGTFILIACELFVPAFAESAGINRNTETTRTSFHRDHIIERYGLLTIIVLGESLLAITMAINALTHNEIFNLELFATIIGALIIMFACWWIYFDEADYHMFSSFRGTFIWGYSHFFIFGSLAALGAGLAVMVDFLTDHAKIGAITATASVTIPTAIFLLFLWFIHERPKNKSMTDLFLFPIFAVLIVLTSFAPYGVLLAALLLVVCLGIQMNQQTIAK